MLVSQIIEVKNDNNFDGEGKNQKSLKNSVFLTD